MTTTNLNTASSAAPSVLVSQYIPTTGAAQYQAAVGTTTQITSAFVTNTDSVAQTVKLIIVKAGGSAGTTPPVLPTISMTAGATLDLGELFLGDGDFIWAEAGAASKVGITLTGIEFSNATGGTLSGIQDDAIGTTQHTSGTGTAVSTCGIGSASNRRLYGGLIVRSGATFAASSSYTTLTMTATGGAMTKKVSADFGPGGGVTGSVHIFELTNPTSASTQTLTASVIKAGVTFDLEIFSLSQSGVASSTVTASSNPTSASALNVSISSAAGHKVLYVCGFDSTPQDLLAGGTNCVRSLNGAPSGFTAPHVGVMMLALGAATTAATTSNTVWNCGAALDIVPV